MATVTVDGGQSFTYAGPFTVDDDGIHTIRSVTTDGTRSALLTVAIDTTDPVVTAETTPAPGPGGWRNSAVTVGFTCHDATSGVASCSSDVTLTGDGANQSVTGTATDRVGHSTTITVGDIDIDSTGPVVTATVVPVAGANGWLRAATVHFDCGDALSGVASCPQDVTVPEGADRVVTGTASDVAGNSSSVTVSNLDVDPTAPVISFVATPTPNGAGWNRGDVSVDVVCTDATSGVASCTGDTTVTTEGASHQVTAGAVDNAGNRLVGNGHRQARPHPADHGAQLATAGTDQHRRAAPRHVDGRPFGDRSRDRDVQRVEHHRAHRAVRGRDDVLVD